ncbi:MAG: hypothetical protein AABX47_02075 [Nanoarchaeota archaeon]
MGLKTVFILVLMFVAIHSSAFAINTTIPGNVSTCNHNFDIEYRLSSFLPHPSSNMSKYQYPYFREDDTLRLSYLQVSNSAKCPSSSQRLSLYLVGPDQITRPSCLENVNIPPLGIAESYRVFLNQSLNTNLNLAYSDYSNRTVSFCGVRLDSIGTWRIKIEMGAVYTNESTAGGFGYNEQDWFKVRSIGEINSDELQISSLKSSYLNILIAIFAVWITVIIELGAQISKSIEKYNLRICIAL